jgi:hypothetical protein
VSAARAPRKQQVRHVHAGDQKHKRDRTKKNKQGRANISENNLFQ